MNTNEIKDLFLETFHMVVEMTDGNPKLICIFDSGMGIRKYEFDKFEEEIGKEKNYELREIWREAWEEINTLEFVGDTWENYYLQQESEFYDFFALKD